MSTVTDLRGKHLMKLADFTPDEITYLIDLAADLKAAKREGREEQKLVGREIALIFEKDSTRTRCAFEVAAYDQGAHVTFIGPSGSHMGHKETVKDTARVLGRMYDAIEYRGFAQETAEELARWSGVPVYNGLTDEWHPTQILADFLTFREHVDKPLNEVVFCYLGDARFNMADSYLIGGAKLGMDVRIASPKSLWPRAGDRRGSPRRRGRDRGQDHDHGRCSGGGSRLRLSLDGRLGLDGGGRRGLEGADRAAHALPDQQRRDGTDGKPGHEVHALPAGLPQHRNAGRKGDLREVRAGVPRGDRGGLRITGLACLRRGREPAAHDQVRDGRDARELTMRVVAALGGNALLRRGQPLTAENQRANARVACKALAPIALEHELVISHGNGPQVGLLALQGSAYTEVDAYPLDLLGAQTEGMIGYLLQQELGNELPFEKHLASLLTLIEVDGDDAAFADPTKPIGPIYSEAESARLAEEKGWVFKPDGESFRRVVASPLPQRIFGIESVEWLLERDCVVICAGGGGIPVMYTDEPATAGRQLVGVEAVIDKDLASALLAKDLAPMRSRS